MSNGLGNVYFYVMILGQSFHLGSFTIVRISVDNVSYLISIQINDLYFLNNVSTWKITTVVHQHSLFFNTPQRFIWENDTVFIQTLFKINGLRNRNSNFSQL